MKNNHEISIDTCVYRDLPDGDELEIEVRVTGAGVPYTPAKTYGDPYYCYPADGGYVDDVIVEVHDGKKWREFHVSEEELARVTEQLEIELATQDDDELDDFDEMFID